MLAAILCFLGILNWNDLLFAVTDTSVVPSYFLTKISSIALVDPGDPGGPAPGGFAWHIFL